MDFDYENVPSPSKMKYQDPSALQPLGGDPNNLPSTPLCYADPQPGFDDGAGKGKGIPVYRHPEFWANEFPYTSMLQKFRLFGDNGVSLTELNSMCNVEYEVYSLCIAIQNRRRKRASEK